MVLWAKNSIKTKLGNSCVPHDIDAVNETFDGIQLMERLVGGSKLASLTDQSLGGAGLKVGLTQNCPILRF